MHAEIPSRLESGNALIDCMLILIHDMSISKTKILLAIPLIFIVLSFRLKLSYSQNPSEVFLPVPFHSQVTGYNCGPADLEMVFDYFGPDIDQQEIADVARTEPNPYGTYTCDMVRATHFSNLSTSVGTQLPQNVTGYTGRNLGYAAFETSLTLDDVKSVLAQGFPIIMLWGWHYRIAVGYNSTHFMFRDSLSFLQNLTYEEFATAWSTGGNWSLLICPWKIELSAPRNMLPGNFTVTANITYPCPAPFPRSMYPSHNVSVAINVPEGLALASGEQAEKTLSDMSAGETASASWNLEANSTGFYTISVEAEGFIGGFVPPIPSGYPEYHYEDRIGGENQTLLAVTSTLDEIPPITTDNYDGLWHNHSLTINLTATDENSGVMETYYRINDGPTRTVSLDGQPYVTYDSSNNTLEYWSVDKAGNRETPRTVTEIKLDKTPPTGSLAINNGSSYTNSTSVILCISGNDAASGIAGMCFSNDDVAWTPWEPFSQLRNWLLLPSEGVKTVYAKLVDNIGWVSPAFTAEVVLDTNPASIRSVLQMPEKEIQPYQDVGIAVNVTDQLSGVSEVILAYSLNYSATWTHLPMYFCRIDLYQAVIPGQSIETSVQYRIVACDCAGNQAIDDNNGYNYAYIVVPELSPFSMLLLLVISTALVCITKKNAGKASK